MFNLNKSLSYAREKQKEEEKKEKEEEKKADVELQKYYEKLYKNPHSPSLEKKGIRIKHRKEDDIYNYGLI
jgi:predicted solute-binding protein